MGSFHPPVLETARLQLRGFRVSDLDALADIYADPAVMRYIRDGVRSRKYTASNILMYMLSWAQQGYGVWAVTGKDDATLYGMCGFVDRAELGYSFARASWGRGFATEAASACLWYGFERLEYAEIGAGALRDNTSSRRVLEKLGMRPQANDFFDRNGGVYYHLLRADYQPAGEVIMRDDNRVDDDEAGND